MMELKGGIATAVATTLTRTTTLINQCALVAAHASGGRCNPLLPMLLVRPAINRTRVMTTIGGSFSAPSLLTRLAVTLKSITGGTRDAKVFRRLESVTARTPLLTIYDHTT